MANSESDGQLGISVLEEENKPEYIIADSANPNAVIHLTTKTPALHAAIVRTLAEAPELIALDQATIRMKVKPTATMSRIRMSFWEEYERAVLAQRVMKFTPIYSGICSEVHFREHFLSDNKKVAYMLTPPTSYVVQVKEALYEGLETLRQIVSAPVLDEEGYLIPRAADVVIKAIQMLDMRVKGAVVQKIDQRTLSLNMNQNVPVPALPSSMEDIDQQLMELKKKLVNAPTRSDPVPLLPTIELMKEESGVEIEITTTRTGSAYRVRGRDDKPKDG